VLKKILLFAFYLVWLAGLYLVGVLLYTIPSLIHCTDFLGMCGEGLAVVFLSSMIGFPYWALLSAISYECRENVHKLARIFSYIFSCMFALGFLFSVFAD